MSMICGRVSTLAQFDVILYSFDTVMANAIWACYRRALELGGENSNVGPGRNRGGT